MRIIVYISIMLLHREAKNRTSPCP